jgi:hypothetical protein
MRISSSLQFAHDPFTISRQLSKLLRGVKRIPLGPSFAGFSGFPAQLTDLTISRLYRTR